MTTTGQTVLDRLKQAFPQCYIGLRASGKDHEFNFGYGATIYIRTGTLNIARIRHGAIVNSRFPNSDRLLAYVEDKRNGIYRHTTRGRDEYHFELRHVGALIRILERARSYQRTIIHPTIRGNDSAARVPAPLGSSPASRR